MKTIELPALQRKIEVPYNVFYQYDGKVESLEKHSYELDKKYGNINIGSLTCYFLISIGLKNPSGACYCHSPGISIEDALENNYPIYSHIYIKDSKNIEDTEYFLIGHEEMEFLIRIGREDILKSIIEERGWSYKENISGESKCDIAGIHAFTLHNPEKSYIFRKKGFGRDFHRWFKNNNIKNITFE